MSRRVLLGVSLLFLLSGASGLVYEVVWIRMLSHVLGGTARTVGLVLAAYMGGLALGSAWLGRSVDRWRHPLRRYALLEFGVGMLALVGLALFPVVDRLHVAAVRSGLGPFGTAVDVLLVAAIVMPPTLLMGGTLPVLGRWLVRLRDRVGRDVGLLYAVNTAGAVAGVAATGFFLVPAFGLRASLVLAAGVNVVVAALALGLDRRSRLDAPPAAAAPARPKAAVEPAPARRSGAAKERSRRSRSRRRPSRDGSLNPPRSSVELHGFVLLAVFAGSGFAALGLEVYWTRTLQHFLGNTTFAFSTMLATYLFGLALGAVLGGRMADRVASPSRLLGVMLLSAAVAALLTVPLLWNALAALEARGVFAPQRLGWTVAQLRRVVAAFAVMVPASVALGAVFPIVQRLAVREVARVGRTLGLATASNTLGAIAGSLVAVFVVLPILGVRRALLATALGLGVLGVTVLGARRPRGSTFRAGLACLLLLAIVSPYLDGHARRLLSDTQRPFDTVLFQRQDAIAETRVYRKPTGELHLSVEGHHIGGTEPGILRKEKVLAHLPASLVSRMRSVLAVGLGSGMTLAALAAYTEVETLVVVEIVPGVFEAARWFDAVNHAVLDDPRVRPVQDDGMHYLRTTRECFDVISSDSKLNPEHPGNAGLLAADYYRLGLEHLTPGGVMVQWVPMHLPHDALRLVVRSFTDVFPYAAVFWTDAADLVLVGSREPLRLDGDVVRRRRTAPRVQQDLEGTILADLDALAASLVARRETLRRAVGPGPRNTWDHPLYAFTVVRAFHLKDPVYHENDNLRWLAAWYEREIPDLGFGRDPARAGAFRRSTQAALQGYVAAGGGLHRLEVGRRFFAEALRDNPEDVRLQAILAHLDRARRASPEAEAAPSAEELVQRGLGHLERGELEAALASFDRAVTMDPNLRSARYDRLLVLARMGRDLQADVEAFVRDFRRDARGWSLRGELRARRGDLEGALADFERAIELDPSTVSFQNNRAVTLGRLGHYSEAAAAFAAIHERDPRFPDAAFLAAASYARAGDHAAARTWIETCLRRAAADPQRFLRDPSFAAMRNTPWWPEAALRAALEQQP